MGQMRFYAPQRDNLPSTAIERAYLAGMEGIPWRSRTLVHNQHIVLERPIHESGNLYIPWNVSQHGEVVLSTASLMENERPYHLPLELARGTLNRLRNYVADVQMAGYTVSPGTMEQISRANRFFIEAATSQDEPVQTAELSEKALEVCLSAMDQVALQTACQALAARCRQGAQLHTLLAGTLNQPIQDDRVASAFAGAFNSAAVATPWREIEANAEEYQFDELAARLQWCQRNQLRICAGPLLRLDRASLPDWAYLWEEDFEQIQAYVCDYIHALVQRFTGKVNIWHVAAALNVGGELALNEEQRLRLAVASIETVRRIDQQTPIVISFDQPWAEYLAKDDSDLSPLHFADALARADLGIAGLGMELNLGYWPGGTLPRDLLEVSRQIDRWSMLGLPLLVTVSVPSRGDADPAAMRKTEVVQEASSEVSEQSQKELIERLVPLLLSKHAVHGVIWNQVFDSEPHPFPHGGLFDSQQKPKPALAALSALRKEYLA